jgi:hypothetical protein
MRIVSKVVYKRRSSSSFGSQKQPKIYCHVTQCKNNYVHQHVILIYEFTRGETVYATAVNRSTNSDRTTRQNFGEKQNTTVLDKRETVPTRKRVTNKQQVVAEGD